MKKLLGLGFAFFCVASVATSCGDDDSAPAVNLDNLAKKWYYVSYKLGGQTVPYDGNETCGKDYLQFIEPGTVKDVDVYDCQQDPLTTQGTYTVADKTLTMVLDGETDVRTITKLNATNLETESTFQGATITNVYTSTP